VFERDQGDVQTSLSHIEQAISRFPQSPKFYMMKGQICVSQGNINAAREAYRIGVKNCPKSIPLWLMSSRLEESQDMVIKSRALLDKARGLNPRQEELWLETINIEQRAGTGQEKNVLAKGKELVG
jgi:pre-mRNA-processing factor 6